MNRNLYFQADGSQALVATPDASWSMEEWAAYTGATGWEVDSPAPGDPGFVAAAAGDFRLAADSPAIDAGDVASSHGRTTDFYGLLLVGAPDLGAIEYRPE
jgi:hypothetical protein